MAFLMNENDPVYRAAMAPFLDSMGRHRAALAEIDYEFEVRSAKLKESIEERDRQNAETLAELEKRAAGRDARVEDGASQAPWPAQPPRTNVLSFGAEELEDAVASAPTPPTGFVEPAAAIPAPPPEPEPEPAPPARPTKEHLLSFGADDTDEQRPPPASPVPRPSPSPRPARAEREDDDWSDTNWIR